MAWPWVSSIQWSVTVFMIYAILAQFYRIISYEHKRGKSLTPILVRRKIKRFSFKKYFSNTPSVHMHFLPSSLNLLILVECNFNTEYSFDGHKSSSVNCKSRFRAKSLLSCAKWNNLEAISRSFMCYHRRERISYSSSCIESTSKRSDFWVNGFSRVYTLGASTLLTLIFQFLKRTRKLRKEEKTLLKLWS